MRHAHTILCASLLLSLFAVILPAQPYPVRGTLTNRDIVTLAKAGFEENFVIDIVRSSQSRFDMSVEGLADLSQHGVSQRLIQVMLTPAKPVATADSAAATIAQSPSSYPLPEPRDYTVSSFDAGGSGNVLHYELTSSFWGLRRKEVVVGVVHRPGSRTGAQLPASYFHTRYPRYALPVGGHHAVQQPH